MNRKVLTLLALGMMGSAHAESVPQPGSEDARVRVVDYSAGQVYRLQGFVGYALHLEFAPGETFEGLGAGDIDAISVVASSNHLFIKPKLPRVSTNLTLLTTQRTYHIDYTVTGRRAEGSGGEMIYSLRFQYPKEEAQRSASAARQRGLTDALHSEGPRNDRYDYCGPPALKPLAAFDDGVATHLRFAPRADLPAVFVRQVDGSEGLVNFTVEGEEIILHRVAQAFVLRRGKLSGCVVNQAFDGGSEALTSGTVTSEVTRSDRGATP